jgi:hypothetical protein
MGYLEAIVDKKIDNIEALLRNERLLRHLWVALALEPDTVRAVVPYTENPSIVSSLRDALRWYSAFRCILPKNGALEEISHKLGLSPYRITLRDYIQKRREFIKGLIYE